MANTSGRSSSQEPVELEHRESQGATGDGRTGVPANQHGISNRPGDSAERDDSEGDEPDDDEINPDEVDDPKAEPGKPI